MDKTRKKRCRNAAILSTAMGWVVFSQNRAPDYAALPPAVSGTLHAFTTRAGVRMAYYAEAHTEGRPLVLVHSVNAAPSSYEMKPLYEHFRGKRPVYALELPGFGQSERSNRPYSPQLFVDAIIEVLDTLFQQSVDVIALSLGCEFVSIAALQRPDVFNSLVLISPTGLSKVDIVARIPSKTIHRFVTLPALSQSLFDLLTRRGIIRYYLNQSFVGDAPDDFIEYAYNTAHQQGARHAPLYFLSAYLFSSGVAENVYQKLEVPVLMLYDEDPNVSFERLPQLLRSNKNWHAQRIVPSKGLPHWERLQETVGAIERFWVLQK